MKILLLLTVATGFLFGVSTTHYGAAQLEEQENIRNRGILDNISRHNQNTAWVGPMWARPEAVIGDKDLLYGLNYERLTQINDPFIQELIRHGGSADVSLALETQHLTAEDLFKLAIDVEQSELNDSSSLFILDWLLQAFLLGHDTALVKMHEYAAVRDEENPKGKNNPIAQNLLGLIYGLGVKVNKDEQKSYDLFVQAVQGGLDQAQLNLLTLLVPNNGQFPDGLLPNLAKQVRSGSREAAYQLSKLDDIPSDQKEYWFTRAVKAKHPIAAFIKAEREYVAGNKSKAMDLYTTASEQGNADATAKLADFYSEGVGVETSKGKANNYSEKAKQQRDLFDARESNGGDPAFREVNEYPQYDLKEVPLTPWVASCLREYKGDILTQEESWNKLKILPFVESWMYHPSRIRQRLRGWAPKLNTVSEVPLQSLAKTLLKFPDLRSLDLNLNDDKIGEAGTRELIDGLKSLTGLTRLTLGLNFNKTGETGVRELIDGLKSFTGLTSLTLDLTSSGVEVVGTRVLIDRLKSFTGLTSLTLCLSANRVGDDGTRALSNGLKSLTGLTSLILNLSHNGVGDAGARALIDGLKSLTGLTSLTLSLHYNGVGEAGARALIDGLKSLTGLTSLTLDLYYNGVGEVGARALIDGLKSLTGLTSLTLDLVNNNIGEVDGNAIGESLKVMTGLTSLNLALYSNNIGEATKAKMFAMFANKANFSITV